MIGSNINKLFLCVLVLFVRVGVSYAQAPVITPKTGPIIIKLDDQGNYTLTQGDVCSVTPDILNPNPTVTLTPSNFTCFNTGKQTVTITASDANTPINFNQPTGIVLDKAGNIYIADAGNHKIRKIAINGDVTDFAGSGAVGTKDGQGTAATFDTPEGIAIDNSGNLYVTDAKALLVRKITPGGLVSTLAGTAYSSANDRGSGIGVSFDQPYGIAVDSQDNVFVADAGGNRIRKITPDGQVTTYAGNFNPGYKDGPAATALFFSPAGITIDKNDNIYVADTYNNMIRKITPQGNVTTVAGNIRPGIFDAVGTNANFNTPFNLIVDNNGNIYVADTQNDDIRKIDANNSVTTIMGDNKAGDQDGYVYDPLVTNKAVAEFSTPIGLAITAQGNILIGDVNNNKIRQMTNMIGGRYTSTFAGNGTAGATNGNIYYQSLHTSTATVDVDVQSYLEITNNYSNVTLTPCQTTMPDFTQLNPAQYKYNCNGNVVIRQDPLPGTPLTPFTTTTVTITAENAEPDYAYKTFKVSTNDIDEPPTVTITPSNPGTICAGDPLTFTATTKNAVNPTYQWTVNGESAGTNSSTFTSSTFTDGDVVACNIISSQCMAPAASTSYTVYVEPLPTVTFNGGIVLKYNNSIQLNPLITGNVVSYQWSPTDGLSSSTIPNPILTGVKTATYHLTVTSPTGCTGEGSINVQVFEDVVVPSAFTPNGDGINDLWDIPALLVYPDCLVSVYNRYGSLVFHSVGYPKSWDGTYSGSSLPSGTYYYIIDLKNGKPKLAGPVSIIK